MEDAGTIGDARCHGSRAKGRRVGTPERPGAGRESSPALLLVLLVHLILIILQVLHPLLLRLGADLGGRAAALVAATGDRQGDQRGQSEREKDRAGSRDTHSRDSGRIDEEGVTGTPGGGT